MNVIEKTQAITDGATAYFAAQGIATEDQAIYAASHLAWLLAELTGTDKWKRDYAKKQVRNLVKLGEPQNG